MKYESYAKREIVLKGSVKKWFDHKLLQDHKVAAWSSNQDSSPTIVEELILILGPKNIGVGE